MASQGTRRRDPRPAGNGVNRLNRFIEQSEQEIDQGRLTLTEAAHEVGADATEILGKAGHIIKERERQRQIKLHERDPDKFTPGKKSEAVVKTLTDDTPDMRFVENKMRFQADPGLRVDGKTPDGRFLEHRPDLLALRLKRGNGKAGVVFEDDE